MDENTTLPFKVEQLAESRSFQAGFRGAWFRCKIKEISWRKGQLTHALEFFDFPDEKVKWTRLYQLPPVYGKKPKEIKRQLILRPEYPQILYETQLSSVPMTSGVAVVVDGVWKVGDLVDWWTDGCYWSGTVTQTWGNDKYQIELTPPPVGEGGSYEVSSKDLRPSLDWSPELGWTVPILEEGENSRCCARLIQPVTRANSSLAPDKPRRSTTEEISNKQLALNVPQEPEDMLERNMDMDSGIGKSSWSDSVSSSHIRNASAETAGTTGKDDHHYGQGSSKRIRTVGGISLNSMCSDSLGAAIMDLEELANRVKWLKRILEYGIPLSNALRPPWKFVEHRETSHPK